MDPIAIAFWIALATGLTPQLVGGLDPRVDRIARPKWGKPAPVEYRTWSSSPSRDGQGNCTFMLFALVTRSQLTRLRINGEEQILDWSWSWPVRVPQGMRGSGMLVEFIDAVSGEVVANREMPERCEVLVPGDRSWR